jgi:hypothetical protein
MSKKHFGHSHHSHHSHHHKHESFWDHHHAKHGYVFGTRGDDVLVGTEKSNVIIGRKGNDELFGNGGNDWLDGGRGDDQLFGGDGRDRLEGGRGNDLLDGGAGSDKVFGGKGDDIAVYSVTENASADACGRGDFYDGGKGNDILRLILTPEEMDDAAIQADIAAFQAFLADNPKGCGRHGEVFEFKSFDLTVRNFEKLEIEDGNTPPAGGNTPPAGVDDFVQATEDIPVIIPVLANDSDGDGDLLSPVVVDDPTHGTLAVNADGTITYTPDPDYNSNYGPDGFTYRASDGTAESGLTNVVIDVTPVNDAPRMVSEPNWGAVHPLENIRIDILALYAPGPPDESDQTIELDMDPFFFTTYGVAGKTPENTVSYTAFSVPPDGYETISYTIFDDVGGVTNDDLQIFVI